jgi:hypothetical protein
MAVISIGALMVSIQAVNQQILKLELLLSSEPSDAAGLQDLLFSYEQTAEELRVLYLEKKKFAENFPDYELLLGGMCR